MPLALHDVVSALVSTLAATSGLATPDTATDSDVIVYDGPQPVGARPQVFVLVGTDGIEGTEGATFTVNDQPRVAEFDDEAGEITCAVWAASGDTSIATLRETAGDLVSLCVATINAAPTLGGALPVGGKAIVRRGSYVPSQTTAGAVVLIRFYVSYVTTLI